ncbi:MAG: hypothetical protein AAB352_00745 [Patescibacteria group bacterium]
MAENIQEKIENKIIDLIALGAGGRLIVFKPQNSFGRSSQPLAYERGPTGEPTGEADKDLVVEKKGDYKKKPIFLKIYDKKLFDKVLADKDKDKNFYLIFARFDIVKQDIEDEIFIVSSVDSKKIIMSKKDFVRFLLEKFEKRE